MRLLLDTHALLWFYVTDPKLSPAARTAIEGVQNQVLVSPASYWEVAIKLSKGKLTLAEPFPDFVQHAIFDNGFAILPIEPRHTAALTGLPFHHRDPFDRLLVAQAIVENVPLITCDPDLTPYPITRIW